MGIVQLAEKGFQDQTEKGLPVYSVAKYGSQVNFNHHYSLGISGEFGFRSKP